MYIAEIATYSHKLELVMIAQNKDCLAASPAAAAAAAAKLLQSCPTLCDPVDGGPTGSPVPGILQARTANWV